MQPMKCTLFQNGLPFDMVSRSALGLWLKALLCNLITATNEQSGVSAPLFVIKIEISLKYNEYRLDNMIKIVYIIFNEVKSCQDLRI